MAKTCQALLKKLRDWNEKGCPETIPLTAEEFKALTHAQLEEFLSQLLLSTPLSEKAIVSMQDLYNFKNVQNAEIKFRYVARKIKRFHSIIKLIPAIRWLRLCIQAHYKEAIPQAVEFATSQGRMKYCRPLFRFA